MEANLRAAALNMQRALAQLNQIDVPLTDAEYEALVWVVATIGQVKTLLSVVAQNRAELTYIVPMAA